MTVDNHDDGRVPASRKVVVLTLTVLVFLGAVFAIIGSFAGWFNHDDGQSPGVATINNAPTSQSSIEDSAVVVKSSASASESIQASVEQLSDKQKNEVSLVFSNGMSAFDTPETYTSVANSYFYSYKDKLPELYAAHSLGDVTIQSVEPSSINGAVNIVFSVGSFSDQKVTAYWVESVQQLKIVNVSLTDQLKPRLVQSNIESVKYL